ncbi:MAG TPA: DUF2848 domain-containing protein, partial [Xanthobacteraceae bacterium]|nr:DUF2848 domain-containing protein [Xanthobacteraceae bacterium]
MFVFECLADGRSQKVETPVHQLIVAGWTGRDQAALLHHVEELAAIGVPRPSSMPVFYRNAATNVVQTDRLEVLGPDTSGEVEPFVLSLADGLWVGVGSDHTDRKAETMGIALSKQLCGKPIGKTLWRLDDIAAHWDQISIRAFATIGSNRVLYQDGKLAAMRTPSDLLSRLPQGSQLSPGTLMLCGTVGAIGGIRPAERFEMELEDPVLGRRMTHA